MLAEEMKERVKMLDVREIREKISPRFGRGRLSPGTTPPGGGYA